MNWDYLEEIIRGYKKFIKFEGLGVLNCLFGLLKCWVLLLCFLFEMEVWRVFVVSIVELRDCVCEVVNWGLFGIIGYGNDGSFGSFGDNIVGFEVIVRFGYEW